MKISTGFMSTQRGVGEYVMKKNLRKLCRMMINYAVSDYMFDENHRASALAFFQSGKYFELFCEGANLNGALILKHFGLSGGNGNNTTDRQVKNKDCTV